MAKVSLKSLAAPAKRYECLPCSALDVIIEIQREPTPQRLSQLGAIWNDARAGILLVAQITDKGVYHNTLHIYDGGTRWRVAKKLFGEDYEFDCFIRPMTLQEAAVEFLAENRDSMNPHFFYQYRVGLVAKEPVMLAIEGALKRVGVVAGTSSSYGNGQPGSVGSLKACERIISNHAKAGGKKGQIAYSAAAQRLADVLDVSRSIYNDKSAHNADLIQAIARLWALNEDKFKVEANVKRFVTTTGSMTLDAWNSQTTSARKLGGSESRSTYLAYFIRRQYNKRLAKTRKLVLPEFTPVETPADPFENGDSE